MPLSKAIGGPSHGVRHRAVLRVLAQVMIRQQGESWRHGVCRIVVCRLFYVVDPMLLNERRITMTRDILRDRESAFEFEFCHKVDQKLLANLREQLDSEERQAALARATGIEESDVLAELDAVGIRSECVLAFSLFPLVHVAWADGSVDERERVAVLESLESIHHGAGQPSRQLLEVWLDNQPCDAMLTAWKHYVAALMHTLTPVARRAVKFSLISRSRRVAESAGGILGIHKTSAAEEAAIGELETAFSAPNEDVKL